ncbi:MAG: transglutaminase domain-containing protein [Xanthomonadales bacterium]|nr:transglutaminase domain-containing protein [Xanthomonadales bacterium]
MKAMPEHDLTTGTSGRRPARPGHATRLAAGRVLALLLAALTMPAAVADDLAARSLALVEQLLVTAPFRIPASARQGEIRYEVRFRDGRHWSWPQTGEQRVRTDRGGWWLTVCDDCGSEARPDDAELDRLRLPNAWVDSDHPRVRRFARRHAGSGTLATRMRRLTQAVQAHMDGAVDYRYYDSASVVLRSRSGDCTEAAVLLAATARAIGLPARIAYGLAYSSRFTGRAHVFSPHAWVQVWDGERWRSFDAALGDFDAGLIALHLGDGDPASLPAVMEAIAHLHIESAAEVRRSRRVPSGQPADAGRPQSSSSS